MSSALSEVRRVSYVCTSTFGLICATRSFATSIFLRPTSLVPYNTWRCRFVSSMTSKSTIIRVQMPPKLVEAPHEASERLFHALRFDLDGIVVCGVLTQGRWNDDSDGSHRRTGSMTELYLRFVPPAPPIQIHGRETITPG